MGFLVYAALAFFIYVFYTQSIKRRKAIKKIDNYIHVNQDGILNFFGDKVDVKVPELNGYSIYAYHLSEVVLKPLSKKDVPLSLEKVQYASNVNYLDIQKGKINGDRKLFFADKDYQHIYVFKEFLDKGCLVFVTKRTSIDDHLNSKFKRH